jgi:glycosyltransferase involved in cell wall biosynthesis
MKTKEIMESASASTNQSIIFMGNFSFPKGMAASKRIKHLCDYFVEENTPARILMIRQGRLKDSEKIAKGVHEGIPFSSIGLKLKPNWKLLFYLPWMLFEGVRDLLRYKNWGASNYLYLYNGLSLENIFFAAFGKLIGYRLIVDIVEDYAVQDEYFSLFGKFKNWSFVTLDKLNLSFVNGVIVISKVLWDKYKPLNTQNTPMMLVPICAHIRPQQDNGHYNSPVRITYAGSFAKKDGIEHLVQAFLEVRKDRPGSVMSLIGMGKNLPGYIEKYRAEEGVEFPGCFFGEDYYRYLEQSDILCVPRINTPFAHAGFPYKLGEYLATGKPIVVSDTGDVRLYLKDKEHAMIVEPGNQEDLGEALAFLLDNPDQAFKIGKNGLKICETEFSPRNNYLKLRELMTRIQ